MQRMAVELKISDYVVFTGRCETTICWRFIYHGDVCVAPDPKTTSMTNARLSDSGYMAIGKPVVSFDLRESRLSAGEAAVYATPNDTMSLEIGLWNCLSA